MIRRAVSTSARAAPGRSRPRTRAPGTPRRYARCAASCRSAWERRPSAPFRIASDQQLLEGVEPGLPEAPPVCDPAKRLVHRLALDVQPVHASLLLARDEARVL